MGKKQQQWTRSMSPCLVIARIHVLAFEKPLNLENLTFFVNVLANAQKCVVLPLCRFQVQVKKILVHLRRINQSQFRTSSDKKKKKSRSLLQ
jgi:hypothetical protein